MARLAWLSALRDISFHSIVFVLVFGSFFVKSYSGAVISDIYGIKSLQ